MLLLRLFLTFSSSSLILTIILYYSHDREEGMICSQTAQLGHTAIGTVSCQSRVRERTVYLDSDWRNTFSNSRRGKTSTVLKEAATNVSCSWGNPDTGQHRTDSFPVTVTRRGLTNGLP